MDNKRRHPAFEQSQHLPKRARVGFEDHFSQLPDDCLLSVFGFVDHDVLDKMSLVSARMHTLAECEHSRNRAVKIEDPLLIVMQISADEFDFNFQDHSYFVSADAVFKDMERKATPRKSDEFPQKQQNSKIITERSAKFLRRFDFNDIFLLDISIDTHFIKFVKKIVKFAPSLRNFAMRDCCFDNKDDRSLQLEFKQLLCEIRPSSCISLCFLNTPAIYKDENFLALYSEAVELPTVNYFEYRIDRNSNIQSHIASDDFTSILPRFKSLIIETKTLTVSTNGLAGAIMTRLRAQRPGMWEFPLTRDINLREIKAVLGEDMTLIGRDDQLTVVINGASHAVAIRINANAFQSEFFELEDPYLA